MKYEERSFAFIFMLLILISAGLPLRIEPSGKTKFRKLSTNLYLECLAEEGEEVLEGSLEWYKDSQLILDEARGSTRVYVEPSSPLSLPLYITRIEPGDESVYYCRALSSDGAVLEVGVALRIYRPVGFKDAPRFQRLVKGQDGKILCQALGSPQPEMKFERRGMVMVQNGKYKIEEDGLLVKNVEESDAGFYKCKAMVMSTGELKMTNIHVEILVQPQIHGTEPISQAFLGTTAVLHCNATGFPPPKISWYKDLDAKLLKTDGNYDVHDDGTLLIRKVKASDSGIYNCEATNAVDTDTREVYLTILSKPSIDKASFPASFSAVEGEKVVLRCGGRGTPKPTIRWERMKPDGVDVQFFDDERIKTHEEEDNELFLNFLIVDKVRRSDEGEFKCIVENKHGTAERTTNLIVNFSPSFPTAAKGERKVFTWIGHPVHIACNAIGKPNPRIKWYKDWSLLTDNHPRVTLREDAKLLILQPDYVEDFGLYSCNASNRHGFAIIDTRVLEAKPPAEPSFEVLEMTAYSATLALRPPVDDGGLSVTGFRIEYQSSFGVWEEAVSAEFGANSTTSVVEELEPNVTYAFRVAAINHRGHGKFAPALQVNTVAIDVPEKPEILSPPFSPYSDKHHIRWREPRDGGSPLQGYKVRFRVLDSDSYSDEVIGSSGDHGDWYYARVDLDSGTSYIVEGLRPKTRYEVQVCAQNRVGDGKYSSTTVTTAAARVSFQRQRQDYVLNDKETPFVYRRRPNRLMLGGSTLIGIVAAGALAMILLVDICCCACKRWGVMYSICGRHCMADSHDYDDEDYLAKIDVKKVKSAVENADPRKGNGCNVSDNRQKAFDTLVTLNGSVQIKDRDSRPLTKHLSDIPEEVIEDAKTSGSGMRPKLDPMWSSSNNNDGSPPLPPKEKDVIQTLARQMAPLAQVESDNIDGSRPCSIAVPNYVSLPNLSTISEESAAPLPPNAPANSTPVKDIRPSPLTPVDSPLMLSPISPINPMDLPGVSAISLIDPRLPPKEAGLVALKPQTKRTKWKAQTRRKT